MKRLLLSILAAIALPTAVNAEKFDITCFWKMENVNRSGQAIERFIIDTELDKLQLDIGSSMREALISFIHSIGWEAFLYSRLRF